MEYNHNLENFYNSYGKYVLISSRLEFNDYFSYELKVKSKLSNALLNLDLYRLFTNICDDLIRNGKAHILFKISKNKKNNESFISIIPNTQFEVPHIKVSFTFPKGILSERERKNTISKLSLLNPINLYSDLSNMENMRFANEMSKIAELELGKIGEHYFSSQNSFDYYTDYYCIYRLIKLRINQRKLINYVLKTINRVFIKSLQLEDNDNLVFNGTTIERLESMLDELIDNKSLNDIYKELFNDSSET